MLIEQINCAVLLCRIRLQWAMSHGSYRYFRENYCLSVSFFTSIVLPSLHVHEDDDRTMFCSCLVFASCSCSSSHHYIAISDMAMHTSKDRKQAFPCFFLLLLLRYLSFLLVFASTTCIGSSSSSSSLLSFTSSFPLILLIFGRQ
jgi:hypothetical protein